MTPNLLITEIPFADPVKKFELFASEFNAIFFDAALKHEKQGRYAFIAVDPFMTLQSKNGKIHLSGNVVKGDPFEILQSLLSKYSLPGYPDLPPFQTGVAGYFGYDLGRYIEKLPRHKLNDIKFPDMALGFYDLVIAFDLFQSRAWIFSSGFPETESRAQFARAKERTHWMKDQLEKDLNQTKNFLLPELNIISNFNRPEYERAVQQVIDYIYAGDIFQANLSQRFQAVVPQSIDWFQLYKNLRRISPVSFASYLNLGETVILSASPERFIQLTDGKVQTRPIKGTRSRNPDPEIDRRLGEELLRSEKDRAENVMIVDLLRNDLSRVCKNNSVHTPEICVLESFSNVHHLVSTVTGELRHNLGAVDLLRASFPGGSITGAPKIRAMEIISELEPTQRGPYCGSIGYIGFNGNMDTNIVIRTIAIQGDQLTFQVGGGIVADSNPADEYQETLSKAQSIFKVLGYENLLIDLQAEYV